MSAAATLLTINTIKKQYCVFDKSNNETISFHKDFWFAHEKIISILSDLRKKGINRKFAEFTIEEIIL